MQTIMDSLKPTVTLSDTDYRIGIMSRTMKYNVDSSSSLIASNGFICFHIVFELNVIDCDNDTPSYFPGVPKLPGNNINQILC